jgi:hypothetical protein
LLTDFHSEMFVDRGAGDRPRGRWTGRFLSEIVFQEPSQAGGHGFEVRRACGCRLRLGLAVDPSATLPPAVATRSVPRGALYMAVFGAGTVPLLLAIGLSGRLIPVSFRAKLARAIPVTVVLLAALLILRGMSLGIPYLSPDLAAGKSCCQP